MGQLSSLARKVANMALLAIHGARTTRRHPLPDSRRRDRGGSNQTGAPTNDPMDPQQRR
jgi:hypothetical protein